MHALAAFGDDAPPEDVALGVPGDAEAMRAWLRARIAAMLDGDRARLMAVLYRIDVRERDVRAALAARDPESALADAVMARMGETHARRRAAQGPDSGWRDPG